MTMMDLMVQIFAPLVGSAGTMFVGYLIGRKKSNAEAETNEIDNIEKVATIWRENAEAIKNSFQEQLAVKQDENIKLQSQLKLLEEKLSTVLAEVRKLTKINKQLESDYRELKKQLDA